MLSISPMPLGQLLGLADVEIVLDGVAVVICGVQIRGSSQHSEIKAAMGEMVQEAAIETDLLRRREAG